MMTKIAVALFFLLGLTLAALFAVSVGAGEMIKESHSHAGEMQGLDGEALKVGSVAAFGACTPMEPMACLSARSLLATVPAAVLATAPAAIPAAVPVAVPAAVPAVAMLEPPSSPLSRRLPLPLSSQIR